MNPAAWVRALQLTESDGQLNPPVGDDGRAFSSFQVHVDWLWEWAKRLSIEPLLGEKLESFVGRVVTAFAYYHVNWNAIHLAMYFHLGHPSDPTQPDWDVHYAERFEARYAS